MTGGRSTPVGSTDTRTHAPDVEPAFVAAAALAWARSQRVGLLQFPPGWRNNRSQPQQVRVGNHDVRYSYDRTGAVSEASVDGVPIADDWLPALGFIETEIDGEVVFVSRGQYRFAMPPRFASPDDAGRAGSTVAPMPGSILRIVGRASVTSSWRVNRC